MRKLTPLILLMLAVVAGAALVAIVAAIPAAFRRFGQEPEDFFILATLSMLSILLGFFWALSGVRMFQLPAERVPRGLRFAAWTVLVVGCAFFLSAALDPIDFVLSCVVAGACVLSAAAVLRWGGGTVGA